MMRSFIPINPIFYMHSRHKTEVFDVLRHDSQTIMKSRSTNKDVKTANLLVKVFLYFVQCASDLRVFIIL